MCNGPDTIWWTGVWQYMFYDKNMLLLIVLAQTVISLYAALFMGHYSNPVSAGVGHVQYCLQLKWQQRDITPYFINLILLEDVWLVYMWLHPTSLRGSTNVPSAIVFGFCLLYALWLYQSINIVFQWAIIQMEITFLCSINNQDAPHLWHVEQYYFTDIILSCPLGVFGAEFLSPPAQQLLLRGPVA